MGGFLLSSISEQSNCYWRSLGFDVSEYITKILIWVVKLSIQTYLGLSTFSFTFIIISWKIPITFNKVPVVRQSEHFGTLRKTCFLCAHPWYACNPNSDRYVIISGRYVYFTSVDLAWVDLHAIILTYHAYLAIISASALLPLHSSHT